MARTRLIRLAVLATVLVASLAAIGAAEAAGGKLIKNGNAERVGATPGSIPRWKLESGTPAEIVSYAAGGGFPDATSPGPGNRGAGFFAGGPDSATGTLIQKVDLSAYASTIASGTAPFKLLGWLGGYAGQDDNVVVEIRWLNGTTEVGTPSAIGPVLSSDRSGVTGLLRRTVSGTVPPTATAAVVRMTFTRTAGSYNDGYADNLSLTIG
jgi:hypothetical protein